MTLKLYWAPGACSFVPHGLLEIAGATFEPVTVKLHKNEQSSAEFLSLNPRGQVPVLVDGAEVITQIVAIIGYIDQKYAGGKLLPSDALARARTMEKLAWCNNTAHPTFTHVFMPQKFTDDKAAQVAIRTYNTGLFKAQLAEIDGWCAKADPWIAGAGIGPLDLYALTLMRWGGFAGIDPKSFAHLWPHANKVIQHPAVARAAAREKLDLEVKPVRA